MCYLAFFDILLMYQCVLFSLQSILKCVYFKKVDAVYVYHESTYHLLKVIKVFLRVTTTKSANAKGMIPFPQLVYNLLFPF